MRSVLVIVVISAFLVIPSLIRAETGCPDLKCHSAGSEQVSPIPMETKEAQPLLQKPMSRGRARSLIPTAHSDEKEGGQKLPPADGTQKTENAQTCNDIYLSIAPSFPRDEDAELSNPAVDASRCLLQENMPDDHLDIPFKKIILESLVVQDKSVRVFLSEPVFPPPSEGSAAVCLYTFELPSQDAARKLETDIRSAAKACGIVDATAGQRPVDGFKLFTYHGFRGGRFADIEGRHLLISEECLTPARKLNCAAFEATKKASSIAIDRQGGVNPGAVVCSRVGGSVVVLRDDKGNEDSFCRFEDGSSIGSASLYSHALDNDLGLEP